MTPMDESHSKLDKFNPLTPELFYQKHKKNDEMDGISKS